MCRKEAIQTNKLDRVQNAAVRILLSAFRTSPSASPHVETYKPHSDCESLRSHCSTQSSRKAVCKTLPTVACFSRTLRSTLLPGHQSPSVTPAIEVQMQQLLAETGSNVDCIAKLSACREPPWLLRLTGFFLHVACH
jgi:hypothetical protein